MEKSAHTWHSRVSSSRASMSCESLLKSSHANHLLTILQLLGHCNTLHPQLFTPRPRSTPRGAQLQRLRKPPRTPTNHQRDHRRIHLRDSPRRAHANLRRNPQRDRLLLPSSLHHQRHHRRPPRSLQRPRRPCKPQRLGNQNPRHHPRSQSHERQSRTASATFGEDVEHHGHVQE